tara:strand:+ start:302 stop:1087 length:786 start_codon:yes stop_codon:yes gene_type:complete
MSSEEKSKQHVHIVVDSQLWKQFKIEAIKSDETMTSLLEKLLKERMGIEESSNEESESKGGLKGGSSLNPKTPISDKEGSNSLTAPVDNPVYDSVKEIYNQVARDTKSDGLPGFSTCRRLDAKRKRGIERLEKALGENPDYLGYFKKCSSNRHWRGENNRGWRADLEFLTRDDIISKALEIEETSIIQPEVFENPDNAVESAKTRIRRFLDKPHTSEDISQFMPCIEVSVPRNRLDEVMKYFQDYSSYVSIRQNAYGPGGV